MRAQLINYQRCKEASIQLGQQNRLGRDIFTRPKAEQKEHISAPYISTDAMGLLKIFYTLLNSNAAQKKEQELIRSRYSIREMSLWILNRLHKGSCTLNDLLLKQDTLPDRIVCFLSVLELAKLNHLGFEQRAHLKPLHLSPCFSEVIPELPIYDQQEEQYLTKDISEDNNK